MAKQTFTTGQVLTAAQMTSLQQTAMGGGSATAKTTSYVLVAADAGGTVAMNAAGSTTITVNTGVFAAGDTVFIQNLGAGATTITAGTATVSTAGSLILPQYDAGILYFTATSAAIFYDYIQAGAVSPLTTKGDLYTYSTSDARLAVGTNGYLLTADSAEATGLKWAAAAGGGGKVLQVVMGTTSTGVNSATSTYVDSALTVNITPTLNTSKVLILISQVLSKNSSAGATALSWRLMRGSTSIFEVGTNLLQTSSTLEQNPVFPLNYLDSPATTSATTYKTQIASTNNTSIIVAQSSGSSTIIALEIGA